MPETGYARRKRRDRERELLVAAYGNRCMICGAEPKSRALHVDHDHRTGENRGLLCYRCNRNLPTYVTAEWLRAAADYIERAHAA